MLGGLCAFSYFPSGLFNPILFPGGKWKAVAFILSENIGVTKDYCFRFHPICAWYKWLVTKEKLGHRCDFSHFHCSLAVSYTDTRSEPAGGLGSAILSQEWLHAVNAFESCISIKTLKQTKGTYGYFQGIIYWLDKDRECILFIPWLNNLQWMRAISTLRINQRT